MINNKDLERQVLGQLVLEGDRYYDVSDTLTENHFFDPFNKAIYKCIVRTASTSVLDLVTIAEMALNMKNEFPAYLLNREGFSMAYEISTLTNAIGSTFHLEEHINLLNEYRKRRELMKLETFVKNSIEAGEPANDIIAKLSSKIMEVSDLTSKGELDMTGCLEEFQNFMNTETSERLNPTGISEVDEIISGFEYSDLIIVAGAASMGKTSFAMKLLHNFLIQNKKVNMFSLEMNTDQLMTRLVSMVTSITINRMRNKQCDEADLKAIDSALALLHDKEMIIDTQSSQLHQVINKIRKNHARGGLDIVIIDYLQLISHKIKGGRTEEVSIIARSLKNLAKELNVTIIALSQLNRAVSARDNKRPILSDLRESGEIEQAADIIMFAFREAYYTGDTSLCQDAELIIAKGRNSGTGVAKIKFIPEITKFLSLKDEFNEINRYQPQFINDHE